MLINNCYRGCTDRLSGFTYDTDRKTYKVYSLHGKEWTREEKRERALWSFPKDGWREPGDINYCFPTKFDMELHLEIIKELGFAEDKEMALDFGIFKL